MAVTAVGNAIAGLGVMTQSYLSTHFVLIKNPDNQVATVHPYVTAASLNVWGRDVLATWGVTIGTNF